MSGVEHGPGTASRADALAAMRADGCGEPRSWASGPGDTFARHEHPRSKVQFCIDGAITFTTDEGDVVLEAGDRLDLPAGTSHSALAGPHGCDCVEAWR